MNKKIKSTKSTAKKKTAKVAAPARAERGPSLTESLKKCAPGFYISCGKPTPSLRVMAVTTAAKLGMSVVTRTVDGDFRIFPETAFKPGKADKIETYPIRKGAVPARTGGRPAGSASAAKSKVKKPVTKKPAKSAPKSAPKKPAKVSKPAKKPAKVAKPAKKANLSALPFA